MPSGSLLRPPRRTTADRLIQHQRDGAVAMPLPPSQRIMRSVPTVNIFYSNELPKQLEELTNSLKAYVAKELTCGDIKLNSDEVSVRFIGSHGDGMLAPVEIEITAAAFKERVERQDKICRNIQKFILDKVDSLQDVKVWLILAELGHSWK